jgi:diguanylate cyclase (GGDEF)-like protein
MTSAHPRRADVWPLITAPCGVAPYYVGIELVTVALVVLWPGHRPTVDDWSALAVLLFIGIAQAELSAQTERIRRYFADIPHINMTSVWIFAGALLLPQSLAALLTAAIYWHLWLRVWRPIRRRPAYRVLFSGATMAVASLTVAPLLHLLGATSGYASGLPDGRGLPVVTACGLVFTAVNAVLIAVGIKLHSRERRFTTLFGTWRDNALELATLCLGAATAALLRSDPVLVLLMVLPVIVLHRGVLLRQLEEMATQDPKTGLLTDVEWKNRAANELARAERDRGAFTILFVDLDKFKRVNDMHGHLVGDDVLRAVAARIRETVREYDSVGRWGGEEYAVLLPHMPPDEGLAVAERIRQAVATLAVPVAVAGHTSVIDGLSVSIGVAAYPTAGTAVELLIAAADRAMYVAKENGRNRVVSEIPT